MKMEYNIPKIVMIWGKITLSIFNPFEGLKSIKS